ncbi:MAG TPA: response regulator transcription factor [bacterium]|nr:response regulator transcription factor [bacterium]
MKKSKIVVVDDHPIVRHGIALLLDDTDDLRVCGQAGTAKEVLPLLEKTRPDLVLLDLFLQGTIAVELIRKIRERFPNLPILVLSVQSEALFAERALQAGADGYVVKEEATAEILQAIQALLEGGVYVSKKLVDRMSFKVVTGDSRSREFVAKLSDRELQVLKLLGDGASIREAAADLALSAKTVETHCARIKRKLHLRNANELLRFAAQWQSQLSGISR